MRGRALPVGVESFSEIIENQYYYVDKTLLIKELLDRKWIVNVFLRPSGFGKTLTLSMLREFFDCTVLQNQDVFARFRYYENDEPVNSPPVPHDIGERYLDTRHRRLFAGLNIMDAGENYLSHMGQYPVISLTLKDTEHGRFDMAYGALTRQVSDEFRRHRSVVQSIRNMRDRELYDRLMTQTAGFREVCGSLHFLSRCLHDHYRRKAVILIDEYEAPLESAYFSGYYGRMWELIKALFGAALDGNDHLEFAVLTGCLRLSTSPPHSRLRLPCDTITQDNCPRLSTSPSQTSPAQHEIDAIAGNLHPRRAPLPSRRAQHGDDAVADNMVRESLFPSFDYLNYVSILDVGYGGYFGFTPDETQALTESYGSPDHTTVICKWSGGYIFGHSQVCNPRSAINYMHLLCSRKDIDPRLCWNFIAPDAIARTLLEKAFGRTKTHPESLAPQTGAPTSRKAVYSDADSGILKTGAPTSRKAFGQMHHDLETLLAGEAIEKEFLEVVSYTDIDRDGDHLWNLLLLAGFLRPAGLRMEGVTTLIKLAIPNQEVRIIYNGQALDWFRKDLKNQDLTVLSHAVFHGETETFRIELSKLLLTYFIDPDCSEGFYHEFLREILTHLDGCRLAQLKGAGAGRIGYKLEPTETSHPMVQIAIKKAKEPKALESSAKDAMNQALAIGQPAHAAENGHTRALVYGLALFKKRCLCVVREVALED
ncbi:MAG: AAA family ATPase [Lachnospiraceae bacterium]|jgi:hypothetical protein|nr:AAA family ATPase [Lachnospiraceae bacterium]